MDVAGVEPFFDAFEGLDGDGVNVGRGAMEVFEDEDHVEVLESELDTFQMGDFDFFKRDDGERRLGQLYQAIGGRLHENVRAVWNTTEPKIAEWNVDGNALIRTSGCDLVGEVLKFFVKSNSTSAFFLLLLEFFLVMRAMFALAISGLVELHVSGFSIELHIFGFFLPDHDRVLEVDVDDDDEFVLAGLEEKMLHVAEE